MSITESFPTEDIPWDYCGTGDCGYSMAECEAAAKDFAMSHKMNIDEPALITHTIDLMVDAFKAGAEFVLKTNKKE